MKSALILPFLLIISSVAIAQGFINVAAENGIFYTYGDGEYAGGASFVDFDQDGDDDLTIVSEAGNYIHFHENMDGTFQSITSPISNQDEIKQALWVDYDNDSDLDLYLSSASTNKLYKNHGSLFLEDITEDSGFNDPDHISFCSVWFDYNEDGLLDLCTSHRTSFLVGSITLYKNLGNDTFEDVTSTVGLTGYGNSVLAMTTLDINNDGFEDLYIGQDYDAGNLLFKNNGDGSFSNISQTSGTDVQNDSMSASVGDYNNDGWMDIYVTHTQEPKFFINQGDETFIESAVELGVGEIEFSFGAVFLDADNDMDLDLYRNGINNSFMFMNPGNGDAFSNITSDWGMSTIEMHSEGNSIGDFNDDGFPDLFRLNKGAPHILWENDFSENNYLKVKLTGVESNHFAVGAVLELITDGIHQHRRIGCGEGFSSQNSFVQQFGLAQHTEADSLIIKWPNGAEQIVTAISANQTLEITEQTVFNGCMDSSACNYDSSATVEDNSCFYAQPFMNCNGECLLDTDGDGVCNGLETPGCQDSSACNYNPSATDEDGSCYFAQLYYDCEGECLSDEDEDGICDELEVYGCTEIDACNYNENATENDDSCIFITSEPISGEDQPWLSDSFTYLSNSNSGNTFQWEISGGIITDGNGTNLITVEWIETGTGEVTLTETNSDGCSGETIVFQVLISETSILDYDSFHLQIYPNPAETKLNLKANGSGFYSVFTLQGKIITKGQFTDSTTIDTSQLSSGGYLIQVIQNGKINQLRFIID